MPDTPPGSKVPMAKNGLGRDKKRSGNEAVTTVAASTTAAADRLFGISNLTTKGDTMGESPIADAARGNIPGHRRRTPLLSDWKTSNGDYINRSLFEQWGFSRGEHNTRYATPFFIILARKGVAQERQEGRAHRRLQPHALSRLLSQA